MTIARNARITSSNTPCTAALKSELTLSMPSKAPISESATAPATTPSGEINPPSRLHPPITTPATPSNV